ncbi:MAG: MarR family transcriptional regulator [Pseudomonadota bacterium]
MALEHILRTNIARALPRGMELSHFVILNHLAHIGGERTPAQLAHAFNLSRGAITNTLTKLEGSGYVHVRPDWDDARRKQVVISPAGRQARDAAFAAIAPLLTDAVAETGEPSLRTATVHLRSLRQTLSG